MVASREAAHRLSVTRHYFVLVLLFFAVSTEFSVRKKKDENVWGNMTVVHGR